MTGAWPQTRRVVGRRPQAISLALPSRHESRGGSLVRAHLGARYERAWLRGDVLAGVTVAAYLVPQVMAYAEVAGLPAVAGCGRCSVPLLVYAVLGSSRQLSVGPESTTALMTAAAVGAARGRRPGPVRGAGRRARPRGRACCACSAGCCGSGSSPTCCPSRCWSATWPASP